MNVRVGYLIGGQFYCPKCSDKQPEVREPCKIPVDTVNIAPYSQRCARCRKIIVSGNGTELFTIHNCPIVMDEDDVKEYVNKLDRDVCASDYDSYRSNSMQFAIHLLEAIRDDKLLCDRDYAIGEFCRYCKRTS
jgi:hypothetical protein